MIDDAGLAELSKETIRKLAPAKNILLELLDNCEIKLAQCLLRHTYFISPTALMGAESFVSFPQFVRSSREHHKGKQRGDWSDWNGRPVRVCDNTKARLAFARFTKLVMAGDKDGRIRGYHVAHIWERVYDPDCFTAGWNLCLMPGFLKLFTEPQDRIAQLHNVVQQAAFDLYFKNQSLGMSPPDFVTDPKLDLKSMLPDYTPNLLP